MLFFEGQVTWSFYGVTCALMLKVTTFARGNLVINVAHVCQGNRSLRARKLAEWQLEGLRDMILLVDVLCPVREWQGLICSYPLFWNFALMLGWLR